MTEALCVEFLEKVIGKSIFGKKRMDLWDTHKPHYSNTTTNAAKKINLALPGGAIGSLQAADVC